MLIDSLTGRQLLGSMGAIHPQLSYKARLDSLVLGSFVPRGRVNLRLLGPWLIYLFITFVLMYFAKAKFDSLSLR